MDTIERFKQASDLAFKHIDRFSWTEIHYNGNEIHFRYYQYLNGNKDMRFDNIDDFEKWIESHLPGKHREILFRKFSL